VLCPECGAAVAGRAACQAVFDEMLAKDLGDYQYGCVHRLTVDVYALQHPSEYMRSAKSYAAHLTGMRAALENAATEDTNRAVQRWLNGSKVLQRPWQPEPRQRGTLTIVHLRGALDGDDHARRVREWAQSTWEAWRNYHHLAEEWIREASQSRWSDRK
jgi:hypothetical protein